MRGLFNIKTEDFIIATNPITYILILGMAVLTILYQILKLSGLHDLWFIFFRIKKLDQEQIVFLSSILKKRSLKKGRNKWFKWVDRKALKEIKKRSE